VAVYAVGPDGPGDAASALPALSCASSLTASGSGYATRHTSGVHPIRLEATFPTQIATCAGL
jgi:hypothetical protein